MDFVLILEHYELTKPHPEPYLTGLKRFGATKEESLAGRRPNRIHEDPRRRREGVKKSPESVDHH